MPVFDFNQEKKDAVKAEKTYELVYSNERVPDVSHPIMLLSDEEQKLMHHSSGCLRRRRRGRHLHVMRKRRLMIFYRSMHVLRSW